MIFHLFGGQCSGKTTIANRLKDDPDILAISHWDILEDFYIKEEIISEGVMDWDKLDQKRHWIQEILVAFINKNIKTHILIESSGSNKTMNRTLKEYGVTPVFMGVPTQKQVVSRCQYRDVDPIKVINFNKSMATKYGRIQAYLPEVITLDEAIVFIKEKIAEEGKEAASLRAKALRSTRQQRKEVFDG